MGSGAASDMPEIVLSSHFGQCAAAASNDVACLGAKATGLLSIDSNWTPPFVCVSVEATAALAKTGSGRRRSSLISRIREIAVQLRSLGFTNVLVRSSAVHETIDDRGR